MKKHIVAMTGFAAFFILIFCALLTSCEGYSFSENCDQNNSIQISTDWRLYNSETEKPETLELYLYNDNKLSDTRHIKISDNNISFPDGSYKIIACNNAGGIILRNMDNFNSAEANLFTTDKDGDLWIEQPANFVLDNDVQAMIQNDKRGLTIVPRNVIKEISFTFIIKNYTNQKVKYFVGDLSGIGSRLLLSTGHVSREDVGRQRFNAICSDEISDVYKVTFSNLGYAPKQSGQKVIKKMLTVFIEYTNGSNQTALIDLTEEFDKLHEKKAIDGVFDLVISAQNMSLNTQQLNSLD